MQDLRDYGAAAAQTRGTKGKRRQLDKTTTDPGQPARERPPGKLRQLRRTGMDTHRGTSILYKGALTVTPPGTCKPGARPLQGRGETEPTDTTEAPLRVRHRGEILPRRHTHKAASGGTTQKAAIPVGYGPPGSTPNELLRSTEAPRRPESGSGTTAGLLTEGPRTPKCCRGCRLNDLPKPSESRQG